MAEIVLRKAAIDDLNAIWKYTYEKWSEKQADKYYATIQLACNAIGKMPDVGKEYDGINTDLLGFQSGKHIIFYRLLTEDKIEIIRILHARMDLKHRITE